MAENFHNILDSDFNKPLKDLSDLQLVSVLVEKVKYPEKVKTLARQMLAERGFDELKIEQLRLAYSQEPIVSHLPIFTKSVMLIAIWTLWALQVNLSVAFTAAVLVVVSLISIKRRFEIGQNAARMAWSALAYFFIGATLVTLVIGNLLAS